MLELSRFPVPFVGSDPELFLSVTHAATGRKLVVPSELVIPEKGLVCTATNTGKVTRDGVQLELHTMADTCRARISNDIQRQMRLVRQAIANATKKYPQLTGLSADFRSVIRLTPKNLATMSPEAQQLGCHPSLNAYGRPHIQKDGTKYLIRSAAGHLHLSCTPGQNGQPAPDTIVKFLDLMIGNTCVMLDRDELAAVRRKTYGRAGEYRLPKHGIEYRTLSNFWLQNYALMSLVFGLLETYGRVILTTPEAVQEIIRRSEAQDVEDQKAHTAAWKYRYGKDAVVPPWVSYRAESHQALRERLTDIEAFHGKLAEIDYARVEQAINTNDLELATQNYLEWARPIMMQIPGDATADLRGVGRENITSFERMLAAVRVAGSLKEAFFPGDDYDPMEHWCSKPEGHTEGFEKWVRRVTTSANITEKLGITQEKPFTTLAAWLKANPQYTTASEQATPQVKRLRRKRSTEETADSTSAKKLIAV